MPVPSGPRGCTGIGEEDGPQSPECPRHGGVTCARSPHSRRGRWPLPLPWPPSPGPGPVPRVALQRLGLRGHQDSGPGPGGLSAGLMPAPFLRSGCGGHAPFQPGLRAEPPPPPRPPSGPGRSRDDLAEGHPAWLQVAPAARRPDARATAGPQASHSDRRPASLDPGRFRLSRPAPCDHAGWGGGVTWQEVSRAVAEGH